MSVAYLANDRAPMFRVSLILEALRARPVLMFWVAALAQGTLWTLVPSLFYPAPPGDVPLVLAVGKEWLLGSPYGPPLASGSPTSRSASRGIVGVYLLSQLCVVVTFWAVFALGRRIVGAAHATMAVLLMARHQRVHGADARIRPGRAGDAAHRADAAVRLSRARRQQALRLDRARRGARPAACSPPMRG